MLFELDSDQQLWRATVRDVLAKECPPALVRSVADQGADPGPLRRTAPGPPPRARPAGPPTAAPAQQHPAAAAVA